MRQLAIILFITSFTISFNSCKEDDPDPCEGIICLNGGSCANGECNCPPGYVGSDCSQQDTPATIRINKIDITRFPATDNGAGWDLTSGPDIYIQVIKDMGALTNFSAYYENADPSNVYSFEFTPSVDLNEPNDQYIIELYDYDNLDADDFMGGISFTPYFNNNGFPKTINLDAGGDVAFTLHVTYVW
jgi:hypothetical protein